MTNEELIKALRICGNYEDREGCDEECPYFYDGNCPKRIMTDAADAIEAKIPKHGEWEKYLNEGLLWRCSICGSRINAPYHYCPNCGAKMDGERREEP